MTIELRSRVRIAGAIAAALLAAIALRFLAGDDGAHDAEPSAPHREGGSESAPSGDRAAADAGVPFRIAREVFSDAAEGRGEVAGTVVDADGVPITDARVTTRATGGGTFGRGEERSAYEGRARTDRSGAFRVPCPDGAGAVTVYATADGFGDGYAAGVPVGARNVVVELGPARALRGKVVDLGGAAIGGASVRLRASGEATDDVEERTTSADGAFAFAHTPARATLEAVAPGYAPKLTKVAPGGARAEVVLILDRGVAVRGRLVDGDAARPLPATAVELWLYEFPTAPRADEVRAFGVRKLADARSDADGRFEFAGAPRFTPTRRPAGGGDSHLAIWIAAPGRSALWRRLPELRDDESEQAAVDAGDVRVHAALTLRGRVVDGEGRPRAGVRVRWESPTRSGVQRSDGTPYFFQSRPWLAPGSAAPPRGGDIGDPPFRGLDEATSGVDGVYVVEGAPVPGPSSDVFVAPVFADRRRSRVAVPGGAQGTVDLPDLVYEGDPAARVFGRAVDERGAPVAGAAVVRQTTAVTDADGRFALPVAPDEPGPIAALVFARGYLNANASIPRDASAAAPHVVVLRPAVERRMKVVARDGAPLAGALVALGDASRSPEEWDALGASFALGERGLFGQRRTDARGRAVFDRVPPGPVAVLAAYPAYPGGTHVWRRAEATAAEIVVALEVDAPAAVPGGRRVALRRRDGAPYSHPARVAGRAGGRSVGVAVAEGAGNYRFAEDAPAFADVVVERADRVDLVARATSEFLAGAEPLAIVVPDGTSVAGRVVGPTSNPIGGRVVALEDRDGAEIALTSAPIGADGSFELPGLPDGVYRLLANVDGGIPAPPVVVAVRDGAGPRDIRLNVRAGAERRLRIVASTATDAAGVEPPRVVGIDASGAREPLRVASRGLRARGDADPPTFEFAVDVPAETTALEIRLGERVAVTPVGGAREAIVFRR